MREWICETCNVPVLRREMDKIDQMHIIEKPVLHLDHGQWKIIEVIGEMLIWEERK